MARFTVTKPNQPYDWEIEFVTTDTGAQQLTPVFDADARSMEMRGWVVDDKVIVATHLSLAIRASAEMEKW